MPSFWSAAARGRSVWARRVAPGESGDTSPQPKKSKLQHRATPYVRNALGAQGLKGRHTHRRGLASGALQGSSCWAVRLFRALPWARLLGPFRRRDSAKQRSPAWRPNHSFPFQESAGIQPFMETSSPAGNCAFRGLAHAKAVSNARIDVQLS